MEPDTELVAVNFEKVMQGRTYTAILLKTEKKRFAIYTDPASGRTLQLYLSHTTKPRPTTHDLINMIFRGLDIRVKQIVILDLEDTIYFARLFLEQKKGDILHYVEIDARPSDCIALALTYHCPVYCTKQVEENAVAAEE